MDFAALVAQTDGHLVTDDPTCEVVGISLDSRGVEPSFIYAALPGHRTHGIRYVDQALQCGASALLTDEIGLAMLPAGVGVPIAVYEDPRAAVAVLAALLADEPAKKLSLIGVTGTNGKTSVSWMIYSGLIAEGQAAGLIGTLGVRIGDSVVQHPRTTPEAPDLNRTFALMAQQGASRVVMEVSSIAISESRVHGLHFDTAIFTNLSHDHLDYHGDMEAYFAAKAALFDPQMSERGIVVIDDVWGKRLVEQARIPIVRVSLGGLEAEWYLAADIETTWIYGPGVRVPVPAFMPEFAIANYMCALAALQLQGVEIERVAPKVAAVNVPGRLQHIANSRGVNIIIDYAHTPDAVARVLSGLLSLTAGRLITVIGAGGERDAAKRIPMGRAAAEHSSVVMITDDNPRAEEPRGIRASLRTGAEQVEEIQVEEIANRADAIRAALELAEPGDTIAILGKGAEDYQEIGSVRVPFSDEATVRMILGEMS